MESQRARERQIQQMSELELGYQIRDLMTGNNEVLEFYANLRDILRVKRAQAASEMSYAKKGDGQGGTRDYEPQDFWEMVGYCRGVEVLEQEVNYLVRKANEDEKRQAEKQS